jgi:putative transposase
MDGFNQAASMPPDGGQPADAISRGIAALKPAIRECDPPRGCIHRSDRVRDRQRPIAGSGSPHIPGAMSRRGNPYDGAKAESIMKTMKAEAVYLRDYETFED